MTTIPLADDFPHDAGRDPAAEDGVEFGVACHEGFVRIGLEWAGRLSVLAAEDGYDLV